MTNSITLVNNSSHKYDRSPYIPDCCERLGEVINNNRSTNSDYRYICMLPFKEIDPFFKSEVNIRDYVSILCNIFNFEFSINSISEDIYNSIKVDYPLENHHWIEIISKEHRSNKHWVAFHTCLRYTWYLHYSNIAIACVNLYRLNITDNMLTILALASSYQTQSGRALLPSILTSTDAFIYFPQKEGIMRELSNGQNFNTAFMRYPMYFKPTTTIKGSFFDEEPNVEVSAKTLLASIGSLDNIEDTPVMIVSAMKKAFEEYIKCGTMVTKIRETLSKNGYSTEPITFDSKSLDTDEINIKVIKSLSGERETLKFKWND